MNPNLCFEYQQLMLRHDQKNKALLAEEKKFETRIKQLKNKEVKQDEKKEKKLNMVFENSNNKSKTVSQNQSQNENNNKSLFKILNIVAKHKKQPAEAVVFEPAEAVVFEPAEAVVVEPAAEAVVVEPAAARINKNINISKMCKALSSKK
jgi:hypothetical protein